MDIKKVQEYLTSVKLSPLFKKYYRAWGTHRRKAMTDTISTSYQAIQFFYKLIDDIEKAMVTGNEERRQDGAGLIQVIKDTVQVCLSDDGIITSDEFAFFVDYMVGLTESFLNKSAAEVSESTRMDVLDVFFEKTAGKLFMRNLSKLNESTKQEWTYLKALSSLMTHLIIEAEKNPEKYEVYHTLFETASSLMWNDFSKRLSDTPIYIQRNLEEVYTILKEGYIQETTLFHNFDVEIDVVSLEKALQKYKEMEQLAFDELTTILKTDISTILNKYKYNEMGKYLKTLNYNKYEGKDMLLKLNTLDNTIMIAWYQKNENYNLSIQVM